jgi:hypothetical protein
VVGTAPVLAAASFSSPDPLPLSPADLAKTDQMCRLAAQVFGVAVALDPARLQTSVVDSLRQGSEQYGVREAARWAQGFRIDPAMVREDVAAVQAAGSLAAYLRLKLLELCPARLAQCAADQGRS